MREHNGHKVLGNYCWNCRIRTKVEIPGWTKADRSDGPKSKHMEGVAVTWKDGTHDSASPCVVCHKPHCSIPVHPERYREIGYVKTDISESVVK